VKNLALLVLGLTVASTNVLAKSICKYSPSGDGTVLAGSVTAGNDKSIVIAGLDKVNVPSGKYVCIPTQKQSTEVGQVTISQCSNLKGKVVLAWYSEGLDANGKLAAGLILYDTIGNGPRVFEAACLIK
jgi:hypothetical protein